ncbi:unnamed protein product [Colias eurytheme]|nr:unnamed protein product [Colias eurytheme]
MIYSVFAPYRYLYPGSALCRYRAGVCECVAHSVGDWQSEVARRAGRGASSPYFSFYGDCVEGGRLRFLPRQRIVRAATLNSVSERTVDCDKEMCAGLQ